MNLEKIITPPTRADSAWKNILDVYFKEFMEFFYPKIAAQIDWSKGFVTLDKELQSLTKDSLIGKRLVDKLLRVTFLGGKKRLVLVHVEVQGEPEKGFPLRLFQYFYRLFDRYHLPVVTLALLTDTRASWRPDHYEMKVGEDAVNTFRFKTVKLLDYKDKIAELETTKNPFGIVVLAQLAAWETQGDPKGRLLKKTSLTRRLYERGLGRDEIVNLYTFLDWLLTLPEELEITYNNSIHELEESRAVNYITTAERIGIKKGYQQGIEQGIEQGMERGIERGKQEGMERGKQEGEYSLLLRLLNRKFKTIPQDYRQRLAQADAETLLVLGERVLDATCLEDVFIDDKP